MSDVPFSITITRGELSLADLVISGIAGTPPCLVITGYSEPAIQWRRATVESRFHHGEVTLSAKLQQTRINFDVRTDAATEASSRSLFAQLRAALGQWSYTVKVAIDDATVETWTCKPGDLAPAGGRDYPDLAHHNPVWQVSIPAYPVRS